MVNNTLNRLNSSSVNDTLFPNAMQIMTGKEE